MTHNDAPNWIIMNYNVPCSILALHWIMFCWSYLVFTPSWRLERTSRFARRTRHTGNKGLILRLGLILFVWWTSRCIVHFVWRGLYYWAIGILWNRSDTPSRKTWIVCWKWIRITYIMNFTNTILTPIIISFILLTLRKYHFTWMDHHSSSLCLKARRWTKPQP